MVRDGKSLRPSLNILEFKCALQESELFITTQNCILYKFAFIAKKCIFKIRLHICFFSLQSSEIKLIGLMPLIHRKDPINC